VRPRGRESGRAILAVTNRITGDRLISLPDVLSGKIEIGNFLASTNRPDPAS